MIDDTTRTSRRDVMAGGLAAGLLGTIGPGLPAFAQSPSILARKIPSSGEMLPVIGIGTAIIFDFDHATDKAKLAERAEVLKTLAAGGGKLIDTAPSYGRAEATLGELFETTGLRSKLFIATKVRVNSPESTTAEMKASFARLKVDKVDLMQLHNPKDPNQSLAQIRDWKQQGICRYYGITSSFDRDYAAVEACLRREKPDFFQIDYSMVDRNSEERLLPAALDTGAAVLTNLPFGRGRFFQKVSGKPLPEWATKEIGVTSWAQFALKWLLGHPAVTAVIPGTDRPQYMVDNLKAGTGPMPDAAMRKKMVETLEAL